MPSAPVHDFPSNQEIIESFDRNLDLAKPILFSLANSVVSDCDNRNWDLLIGDDTSGRLPAIFIHKVLAFQGVELPLEFICGSHAAQKVIPIEIYRSYVSTLPVSPTPNNALIITESAGTGQSLTFLEKLFRERFKIVDFGIVAAHMKTIPNINGQIYLGSDSFSSSRIIYQTFERVGSKNKKDFVAGLAHMALPVSVRAKLRAKRTFSSSNYPLSGVVFDPTLQEGNALPVATQVIDPMYSRTVSHCRSKIEELADEYTKQNLILR